VRISEPGDRFEAEAERMAEAAMRGTLAGPSRAIAGGPASAMLHRACACSDDERRLSRHPSTAGETAVAGGVVADLRRLEGRGQPLDGGVRAFFEPRYGHDFSRVRVHADAEAGAAAERVSALAFTFGRHVVFGAGRYQPGTSAGMRLLGHELAHVVQQGESAADRSLRRKCGRREIGSPSADCKVDRDLKPAGSRLLFDVNCDTLRADQAVAVKALLAEVAALPAGATIEVTGVASSDGPADLNDALACRRAEVGVALLGAGQRSKVKLPIQATGGVGAAGDASNRAVVFSIRRPAPVPPSPPTPGPLCPTVPLATPGTCRGRHDAYCEAAKCFPTNPWLRCVCPVSGNICDAIDAFTLDPSTTNGLELGACLALPPPDALAVGLTMRKGVWFTATNACIWGHWRAAFEAIHDPTRPVPAGVTPEWAAAITTCRATGIGSAACCRAHVVAEQTAIDRCFRYDSALFGRRPTDVPRAPGCSAIAARLAPPPPFTGDFGNVADRIAYGNTVCCR
jgi:outer membrane protein OmpA-like peptidoglycan-associated protein